MIGRIFRGQFFDRNPAPKRSQAVEETSSVEATSPPKKQRLDAEPKTLLHLPHDMIIQIGLHAAHDRPEKLLMLGSTNRELHGLLRYSPETARAARAAHLTHAYVSATPDPSEQLHRAVHVWHTVSPAALNRIVGRAIETSATPVQRQRTFAAVSATYAQLTPGVRRMAAQAAAAERGTERVRTLLQMLAHAPESDEVLPDAIEEVANATRSRADQAQLRAALAERNLAVSVRLLETERNAARGRTAVLWTIAKGGDTLHTAIAAVFLPKRTRTLPEYLETCHAVATNLGRFTPQRRAQFVQHLRRSDEALTHCAVAMCSQLTKIRVRDAQFILSHLGLYGDSEAAEDHEVFLRGLSHAFTACKATPREGKLLHVALIEIAHAAEDDEARVRAFALMARHAADFDDNAQAAILHAVDVEEIPDTHVRLLMALIAQPQIGRAKPEIGRANLTDALFTRIADLPDRPTRLSVYRELHPEFPLEEPQVAAILRDMHDATDLSTEERAQLTAVISPHIGHRSMTVTQMYHDQFDSVVRSLENVRTGFESVLVMNAQQRLKTAAAGRHYAELTAHDAQAYTSHERPEHDAALETAHALWRQLQAADASLRGLEESAAAGVLNHEGYIKGVLLAVPPALAGFSKTWQQAAYALGSSLSQLHKDEFLQSWLTEHTLLQPADYAALTRRFLRPQPAVSLEHVARLAAVVPHISDAQWAAIEAELKFFRRTQSVPNA